MGNSFGVLFIHFQSFSAISSHFQPFSAIFLCNRNTALTVTVTVTKFVTIMLTMMITLTLSIYSYCFCISFFCSDISPDIQLAVSCVYYVDEMSLYLLCVHLL